MLAARVATNGPIRHDGAMGNQDSNSGSGDASILVRELTGDPALMRLEPGEVVTLGRAPGNRLVLHDERASRNHAELHQAADGNWLIRDLIDGDVICIGAVEIQFFVGSPPVDATGTERDTDSGEGGITGEMPSGIEQWHSTIRYRRNRSRLLDDIRESAHTGHKVGQAAAELCRLAFALGRAEEIDAAANRALESAMLGSAAGRGMVLLPKPGTPSKRRILFTDLHGVAAVPSNLKVADVPADLIETVLATDEAILAGPETVAGQPPAITIIAPIRTDGRAIGCIYLSSEPAGG
ncbi:MAG: FHA domain-containing protein, partial [Planctomycetia bacterium]|nr:FHA domain-containing protein [Planctomycetia bacterium]